MLPAAEEPVAAAPCAEAWEDPEAKLEAPTKQASSAPLPTLSTKRPPAVCPTRCPVCRQPVFWGRLHSCMSALLPNIHPTALLWGFLAVQRELPVNRASTRTSTDPSVELRPHKPSPPCLPH